MYECTNAGNAKLRRDFEFRWKLNEENFSKVQIKRMNECDGDRVGCD